MRLILLLSLLVVALAAELPLATECDETKCLLPRCRCSSTDIPGGLAARDVPQVWICTFKLATIHHIFFGVGIAYLKLVIIIFYLPTVGQMPLFITFTDYPSSSVSNDIPPYLINI